MFHSRVYGEACSCIYIFTEGYYIISVLPENEIILERDSSLRVMEYIHSPAYNAWRGNAFEICCVNHVPEIKAALGIAGVDTMEYAWRSETSNPGAQIDLLIDRKDGVINLCEMKYTDAVFEMDKSEHGKLMNRLSTFQKETRPRKAIHMTLVSANGLSNGKYASVFQSVITGEQLF